MSLPQPYNPILCECDGSNRAFAVTWPFFDHDDLVVTYVTASNAETVLRFGKDYKVVGGIDGNGLPAVGLVTTSAIYARGETIRIERRTKATQVEAFADGPFPAKRAERAFDRAMMILEELEHGRRDTTVIRVPANGAAPVIGPADLDTVLQQAKAEARGVADRVATDLRQAIANLPKEWAREPVAAPQASEPDQPVIRTFNDALRYVLDQLLGEAAKRRASLTTPGKELVYIQKQNEARACLDDPAPLEAQKHPETGEPIAKYPHLEAMIGVWVAETHDRHADLKATALFVLGRVADFKTKSAAIERALDLGKQSLTSAQSIEAALSVIASVAWPSMESA